MPVNAAEQHFDLLRRLEDLALRCVRSAALTFTPFLTPAEQAVALHWANSLRSCRFLLFGGHRECERKALFFLPDWLSEEDFLLDPPIRALTVTAAFGTPGHRDYLGALLGLGVRREFVGDIWIDGQRATVFCMATVAEHLASVNQAGHSNVCAKPIALCAVSLPERARQKIQFTVQSPRFDAVVSDVFRISRQQAAKFIKLGAASLNYLPNLKPDSLVKEADVLSLKGYGKAQIIRVGGLSKKGRIFIHAEIYQ